MSHHPSHPGDDLQLLLDGRLPAERRAAVEAHLESCERCRRELSALRQVKAALHEGLPQHDVPTELASRVSASLPAEAAPVRHYRRRKVVAALALAAAAVLVLAVMLRSRPDFVGAATRDFGAFEAGRLQLGIESSDPGAVERFFVEQRIAFPTRVFDFGMMDYRLAGGRVHRFAGRTSALFAYRNSDGRTIVCQMYEGNVSELPPEAERRENNGIPFSIYRRDGLTLVFWQEGDVVCVLVSSAPSEEAIQFAYAKAIKV